MAECNEEEGGLEVEFERAADRLTTLVSTLDSEKLLFFYARFKQVQFCMLHYTIG